MNDYTKPPGGFFGYGDDKDNWHKAKQKPAQSRPTQSKPTQSKAPPKPVVEEVNIPQPVERTAEPPQSQGMLSRISNIFKRPITITNRPQQPARPQPAPQPRQVPPSNPRSVRWVVPPNTRKVTVKIMESNGRLINSYAISNYVSLKPGQILLVEAE